MPTVIPALSDVRLGVECGASTYAVTAAAVTGGGGSGYQVNDLLTVFGGTSTAAAVLKVATIDTGGEVLTVTINTAGSYTVKPTDPVSVTGGHGTLATFNLTWVQTNYGTCAVPSAAQVLVGIPIDATVGTLIQTISGRTYSGYPQFNRAISSPFNRVFNVSQDSRLPAIIVQLMDGIVPVNLSGGTVTFSMKNDSGTTIVNAANATLVDGTNGIVSFSWGGSDLATPGRYYGQFSVTIGGSVYKIPDGDSQVLVINVSTGV